MGLNSKYKGKWGFIASEQDKEDNENGKLLRDDVKCRRILAKPT